MKDRDFPGARWWKFDFHTHTPASDFEIKDIDPEDWLKAFMEKEIDCLAVTDHNSGGWIDLLKTKLEELKHRQPPWYRPLYLFPGVEISASGPAHILAIFGLEKTESDIDSLLGAVGYPSESRGKTDTITNKNISEVVDQIAPHGGIPIPAHANGPKGLFGIHTQLLSNVLDNENICAMELIEGEVRTHQLYKDRGVQWAEVRGSDTHNFTDEGFGTFTWIKMETPSIDGLKLALIDGDGSVNCDMNDTPNQLPDYFIEELIIDKARLIGHSDPLECRFSPFLNAIIGGRGSGKSTLVEFMRFVLRRENEMSDSLQDENSRYFNVGGDNLLTEKSKISLVYQRNGVRYRLNWTPDGTHPSLEEHKDGNWIPTPGEVKSLFPVYIYSQKEIFEVAKDSTALIDIIDKAPEIEFQTMDTREKALINRYKQAENKQRELDERIVQENRLRGMFNNLVRQIDQIVQSGYENVLKTYDKRQQQLNEFDGVEKQWETMCRRLLDMSDQIHPVTLNEHHFADHENVLAALREMNERWQTIRDELTELAQQAGLIVSEWRAEKNAANWMQKLKNDMATYESISDQLEHQNIDPDEYPRLLSQQQSIEKEMDRIGECKLRVETLELEKNNLYRKIEANRKRLSDKRQEFLHCVLKGNPSVMIKVKTLGADWPVIEQEIRRILRCSDRFDRDIDALKDVYYKNWNHRIGNLKQAVEGILNGERDAKDVRFANHLNSLTDESISDFALWFPPDKLEVTFGEDNQRLEQGSPGQKNAALLTFILSYGDEPLILDQPEDDLDNELIYGLIVQQLRKMKSNRQIIVATHNANIVVNGDAEMVFSLVVENRESIVSKRRSVQINEVREAICDILEGGQLAFQQRYRRINLGN